MSGGGTNSNNINNAVTNPSNLPPLPPNRPPVNKPTNLHLSGLTLRDHQNANLDGTLPFATFGSRCRDMPPLNIKTNPICEDYDISGVTLGLGINGKVVECTNKHNSNKYALKVLRDNQKARREVELHWRASDCRHIVSIIDVYENTYKGVPSLLVVMEW